MQTTSLILHLIMIQQISVCNFQKKFTHLCVENNLLYSSKQKNVLMRKKNLNIITHIFVAGRQIYFIKLPPSKLFNTL